VSEPIQNDKKKTKKLQSADGVEVKAPPAQRISRNLANKLRKDKAGEKIRSVWEKARANRKEWLDRLTMYQQDFDEYKYQNETHSEHKSPEPEGISQLHIPMPLTVIKNVHARFMQALTNDLSPVVTPRRADGIERAPVVKGLMGYTLKEWANYNQGVEEALDSFVWDWVSAGDSVLKVRWHTEYDTYMDVASFVEPTDDLTEVDDQGNVISVPDFKLQEEEVRRLVTRFDGPVFEHKPLEDVAVVGGKGDPQRADYVLDNYMLTASELRTLAAQNLFDAKETEETIKSGPDAQTGQTHTEIKEQRRSNASEGSISSSPITTATESSKPTSATT